MDKKSKTADLNNFEPKMTGEKKKEEENLDEEKRYLLNHYFSDKLVPIYIFKLF